MSTQSVIGVYKNLGQAEGAAEYLEANIPVRQISIAAQNMQGDDKTHGYISSGELTKSGAKTGAWLGGLYGLLIGAAFLWIPGFGPLIVAGPLAAALAETVGVIAAGATAGGVLGALVGWGVAREHVVRYEDLLKQGKFLVIVRGGADEVYKAYEILRDNKKPEDLDIHT
jgi:hypothetical protein